MKSTQELLDDALLARERAYVPYSHFPVGAVVQAADGQVFSGCNVENVSYGLTNCAERTAIFSAVAAGVRELTTLLVVADSPRPVAPCGACRQVMAEFGIKTIHMANTKGDIKTVNMQEILPYAFSEQDMEV